ncbi:TetR family transcriptional regulator [Actinomadura rugatobispora]|uniref:TetR family transcriptional regulator n=1 Tax=Actinomadura rugatobispora TaxID=1994 RepID=A0ABW0ZZ25_9ACTN
MEEKGPRRAPRDGERKVDAERSRRLLLDAALEEFAAKGYAGARVQDIADRAGVNKQLISYYFGGKEGLYQELGRQWLEHEAAFNDPDISLEELLMRYLRDSLDDPRGARLNAWAGLTGDVVPEDPAEDLSDLRRRQAEGEIAAELEVEAVMLLMTVMVAAPATMPNAVRRIYGMSPDSPEFKQRYTEQLRRIVRRLGQVE